ncbi:MAG TPA: hypothetical protein VGH24_12125 [Solirubrobacteraceae bacterium]|jgi:hypothetical protein
MPFTKERTTRARGPVAARGEAPAVGPTRTRVATARGAWAVGSGMLVLARVVRLLVGVIVALIVSAILLRVLGANPHNGIVSAVHDAGRALVGPFDNLFSIKQPKVEMAVNWGLAALVYLIVGMFIARLIARAAPRGVHPAQPVV